MSRHNTPLVSVGLTVFNAKEYLSETLESLLCLDYPSIEIVISDNASDDGSSEICQELAHNNSRVKYHRNATNLGSVKNWNNTLDLAQGKYFLWAADHDLFAPNYVSRAVDILETDEDCTLVYPVTEKIDQAGVSLGVVPAKIDTRGLDEVTRFREVVWKLRKCTMVHGVQRIDNLRKLGGFPNCWAMDMALIPALSVLGTFRQIDEPLFFRRENRAPECKAEEYAVKNLDPSRSDELSGLSHEARFRETRDALVALLERCDIGLASRLKVKAIVYACFWSRWGVGIRGAERFALALPSSLRRPAFLRP